MYEAYIISAIATLLALLARNEKAKYALPLAFVIITVFLSLGYEWGNDVPTYERMFETYTESSYSLFDFQSYELLNEKSEFGFVLINQLCAGIGFWWMRAILFCFENLVIFLLVKKVVPREYYWLAVFIYTVNPNFMILGSSMMRQWLAMCLVVLGFLFLEKRRWAIYCFLVLLASTVHRSAVICLPLAFLPFLQFKANKYTLMWLLPTFFVYYVFSGVMVDFVTEWLKSEEMYSNYTASKYSSGVGGMNVVKLCIYIFMLLNVQSLGVNRRIYFITLLFYGLILPFQNYSGLAARLTYYFTVFTIAVYPLFMNQQNVQKTTRLSLLLIVVLIILYNNFLFWSDPMWFMHFGKYTTLMEVGIL